jgi:hypothetical protein
MTAVDTAGRMMATVPAGTPHRLLQNEQFCSIPDYE